jgi:DNA invertase Pin-like site-specific DNA recombinase
VTRVALYARVSTIGHGQDPELQLAELRSAAADRGWAVAGEYTDSGVSGGTAARGALDRMLAGCRAGGIDVVAVWKLDRLGRSLAHLLGLLEELRTLGVGFVSLRDPGIDTTTAAARLMLSVVGAFAEFERSLIAERVRAGVARAKVAGKHCGRPRRAFDDRAARDLLAQGVAERQVALMVHVPRSTLRRKLAEARAQEEAADVAPRGPKPPAG